MIEIESYMHERIAKSINMAVPFYIMAAYAYYREDDPIISDSAFDTLAEVILVNYDTITHLHKSYLSKDTLEAGTYLGQYPRLAIDSLADLRLMFQND